MGLTRPPYRQCSKALPILSGLDPESLPPSRSLWSLNLGARRRAPPPAPSSPMLMVCPPLPTISQLCAVAPSPLTPSRGPHTSQLAPAPRGPPGRGSGRAVLEVMSLSHEAAARTCHSLNPSRGIPEPRVGCAGALDPRSAFFPLGQVSVPRTVPQVPYLSNGWQVKLLRALFNWHARLRAFSHWIRSLA